MGQLSPSFDPAPISVASTDIDTVIHDLINCVKKFKCPADLDFLANQANGLLLVNNAKNKPFIIQLRKIDRLRTRLAKIPTYDDERLEAKHKAASTAIGRTLYRMKEYQLKLYDRYAEEQDIDSTA
ncbi:hypothetical protein B0J17DRAFT_711124 [Rhizoctonia solani]|nr:hypothetical protein B0J17DRAFT_711124 [Rhizoctonia solani]